MEPTVLVAIIGACATVAAALIAAWFARKRHGLPEREASRILVKAGGDIERAVIGSSNVTIKETRLGPITQIAIENLHLESEFSSRATREPDDNEGKLIFLTERAINYKSYNTGLALSFALRNGLREKVLIYSFTLNLRAFLDQSTEEFNQIIQQLSPVSMFASMIIPVHGARVRIHPLQQTLDVQWGTWDDSAGSRGAALAGLKPEHYAKMLSLLTTDSQQSQLETASSYFLQACASLRNEERPTPFTWICAATLRAST